MTKKLLLLSALCFYFFELNAQNTNEVIEDAWIFLTNKPQANYYIENPNLILSSRALQRRARQQIGINAVDTPVHQAYIDSIQRFDVVIKAKSKWLNAAHVQGTQQNIQALANVSFVDHVEFANRSLNTAAKVLPVSETDTLSKFELVNHRSTENFTYGQAAMQVQMIKADYLHQNNFTGQNMHIAVIDAGFPSVNTTSAFSRIRNNNQILTTYNYVTANPNVYVGNSHGTSVLSTMAGYITNQFVGTAPDAKFHLFVTEADNYEGPLEESWWVEALEKADSLGVDVVNSSLGYRTFDNSNYNYTTANMDGQTSFIARGANVALSRGMIVVNSNGNYRSSAWRIMGTPADNQNIFSVGAVDENRAIGWFSSPGPTADMRIKPDVAAMGTSVKVININSGIVTTNGTSFASPIIAGAIACFWEAFPDKTASEILNLVRQSAHLYQNPNYDMGYGIPDFELAYNQTLSLLNNKKLQHVVFYPNPANHNVTIKLPESIQNGTMFLYNNQGQLVHNAIIYQNQLLNLENLSSGIYMYKISTINGDLLGKIIKK